MSLKKEDAEQIAAKRKKDIVDAAMLLFDEQGYGNTTVALIAKKAGISKGLIYHYFPSKLDILKESITLVYDAEKVLWDRPTLEDAIYINLFRLCNPSSVTNFVPPLRIMYAAAVEKSLSPNDFRDISSGHIFLDHIGAEVFEKCVIDAQKRGEIGAGDPKELGDFIWNHSIGMMLHVYFSGNRIDLKEETHRLMQLLPKP